MNKRPNIHPRKQFTFYRSYLDALAPQPYEIQAEALLSVCRYALYGDEPKTLSPNARTIFELIRPTVDSGRRKADAGALGAASRWQMDGKGQTDGKGQMDGKGQTDGEIEIEKEPEIELEFDSESDSKAIAAVAVEKMITDFSGGNSATADALREYAAMREKKNGKQLSPTVLRLALDDLARLTPDRDAQTAIVRKSVEKRWTSFYAPEVGPESTNAANNEKSYDRKKNPAERAQRREMGGGPDKSSLEYRAVMRMMGTPPDGGGNPDGNE